MVIRMYNAEVESVGKYLMGLSLKGKDSRMRTRFVKQLQERLELVITEHQELVKQHSNSENGKPKVIEKEGRRVYDIRDLDSFKEDYRELMMEEFAIEVTEINKELVESIRNSVWNDDKEYSGEEAIFFDRICEIVEGTEE